MGATELILSFLSIRKPLYTHSGAGRKRWQSIRTQPRWISHSIPIISTSSEKSLAFRSLAQVWPKLTGPQSAYQFSRSHWKDPAISLSPGAKWGEWNWNLGNSVCLENAEIFTLRYQAWLIQTRKGLLLPFYEVINPTGYQNKNHWIYLGLEGRVECPVLSSKVFICKMKKCLKTKPTLWNKWNGI